MDSRDQTRHPGVVAWDLDGTLIDSAPDIAAALNRVLAETGCTTFTLDQVRTMIGGGVPTLIARALQRGRCSGSRPDPDVLAARFLTVYTAAATRETRLFDGAAAVLDSLSGAGYRHALCTNKPAAIAREILAHFGILDSFDALAGGDTTPFKKPHPAPLEACLAQVGARPGDAVVIGDSPADFELARAAGVPIIMVTFGYSQVPVAELGADALVERLALVPEALATLGR
ncbi:MAG: phosphoglycolate phosphatase [Kiloniellales bacterium]|nr:phosphoglycolate phosphatase [Kiloniellales bacterium]